MNTRLAEYVQAPPEDAGFIDQCEKAATDIVAARTGGAAIPEAVLAAATLEVR